MRNTCPRILTHPLKRFAETGLPALGFPLYVSSAHRSLIYHDNPGALVQSSELAMFSASTVGVAVGAPQGYYRAGTPSYTSSEGPARLSHYSPVHVRGATSSSLTRGALLLRCFSRHVKQASALLVGRGRLRLGWLPQQRAQPARGMAW